MLVRAIRFGALGIGSDRYDGIPLYRYTDGVGLLPAGDGDAECADRGSGRSWCMGNRAFRYGQCGLSGSAAMGDKHPVAVLGLAFLEKKCIKNLRNCKKCSKFAGKFG